MEPSAAPSYRMTRNEWKGRQRRTPTPLHGRGAMNVCEVAGRPGGRRPIEFEKRDQNYKLQLLLSHWLTE